MQNIKVTSRSFSNGGWIPNRHGAYGENLSPELIIAGVEPSAVSMAINSDADTNNGKLVVNSAENVKIMLWGSLEEMRPLCESYDVQ